MTNNASAGIYEHENARNTSYFLGIDPLPCELSIEKVLYLFSYESALGNNIMYFDKYGREYKLVEPREVPRLLAQEATPSVSLGLHTPSMSVNPFEAQHKAMSQSMAHMHVSEDPDQVPVELAAQRAYQDWLHREEAPERGNIRGGYSANPGPKTPPQQPQLSQHNQGESRSETRNPAAVGMPPWERVREDRARPEPPMGRPAWNFGLENPGLDQVMRMMDQHNNESVHHKYRSGSTRSIQGVVTQEIQYAGFGLTLEDDAATWFDRSIR